MECISKLQQDFVSRFVPAIRRRVEYVLPRRSAELVEEVEQSAVALAWRYFVDLHRQGKQDRLFPTVLAQFSVAQVMDDRGLGRRRRKTDVLASACRSEKGLKVDTLTNEVASGVWDRRNNVPDQVAHRVDFPAWLKTLSERSRQIALFLAEGNCTKDAAEKFGVSWPAISIHRRRLEESWKSFHGLEAAV